MNFQKIERTVIVTIGSRLGLVAIAIANFDKAAWSFGQWSKAAAWQANAMAGCIEGFLVIFTYMLAQRLMTNAQRLKSDPVQPTKTLWGFVVFLSALSAFCNSLYFVHFGTLANPLGNVLASTISGVVLGLAAPILAGGVAYLQGEEMATEISVREANEKRKEKNRKAAETRAGKKAEAEEQAKLAEVFVQSETKVSDKPEPKTDDLTKSVKVSPKTRQQLNQTVAVYGQDQTTSLGDLAKLLAVGTSRASEIRSLAVNLRLLDKVSAREFSPNGGDVSVALSVN